MRIPSRKLLLSSAIFLSTLAVIEVGLAWGGWRPAEETFEFEGPVGGFRAHDNVFTTHPTRFYTLRAGRRVSPRHAGIYALGDWPFRGAPPDPAPEGIFRVAVVGDSCVFGVGVTAHESLPARIQGECLLQLGLDPTRVQVVGYGVPSYSTVQIRALLEEEVLPKFRPDAIVFYLAAWNDHAPALGRNDVQLRDDRNAYSPRRWVSRSATYAFLRSFAGKGAASGAWNADEIRGLWAVGEPPLGRRVPEPDLLRELEGIFELTIEDLSSAIVVLPAHRSQTKRNFPALARDREAVRRIADEWAIAVVDSEELFEAAPWPADEYLFDGVHPAPSGILLQARAVVQQLGERWRRQVTRAFDAPWKIAAVEPRRLSSLGDQELRVTLAGWPGGAELPNIHLGFAPLLDLAEVEAGVFRGVVIGNSPGPKDLVVGARDGVAWQSGAVLLEPPRLETIRRPGGVLARLHSRPGDWAKVWAAFERTPFPSRDAPGSFGWVSEKPEELPDVWLCGEDGIGEVFIPAAALVPGDKERLFAQAKVVPAGSERDPEAWRWSAVLEFDLSEWR